MIDNKSILGCKYYTYDENNNIMVVRVKGFQSSDTVVVEDQKTKDKYKIKYDDLIHGFTKLLPDGVLCVMSVGISDETTLQDVIVAYSKMKDIAEGNNIPSIICRQNINDIFNFVQNRDMTIVGCCATPTSMPEGVPYEAMTSCNSVNSQIFVSTYLDDELDDILSCFKTKLYDNILNELFEFSIRKLSKTERDRCREKKIFCGYTTCLKDLLETNCFMDEFYLANGILKLGFELHPNPVTCELDFLHLQPLQNICGMVFNTHRIIPYDRDIKLSNIFDKRYLLFKDVTNKVYVFTYTSDSVFDPERVDYAKLYSARNTGIKYNG